MHIIWNFLLIVLIVNYSYGKYTVRWVTTNDQTFIDECLKKSLRCMNRDEDINTFKSKLTNIICKKRFLNGYTIKLYFELEEKIWKCLLYKPPIETLDIKCEKCTQELDDDSLEEIKAIKSNNIIQEQSQVNNDNNIDENDDETKIDELNQKAQEKVTNNDGTEIDNNNHQIPNENIDNQQGIEQNVDTNEKINDGQVENENLNKDETNLDTNNAEQKTNDDDDDEVSNKDLDNENINVRDNDQQEQPDNINNQETILDQNENNDAEQNQ